MTVNHPISAEALYLYQAIFKYHKPLTYLKNKFFIAPKITNSKKVLGVSDDTADLSVHSLIGKRDFINLLWSLGSFFNVFKEKSKIFLHNDGTLKKWHKEAINLKFTNSVIVEPDEALNKVKESLSDCPDVVDYTIANRKNTYLKKFIDPLVVSNKKFHLILDSDLIWFRTPQIIIKELKSKKPSSFLMRDYNHSYPVHFKDGSSSDEFQSHMNSGIVFYKKDNFDLNKMSKYLTDVDNSNPNSIIEQSGNAYCLNKLKPLPDTYKIHKKIDSKTTMRHYTGLQRALFFIEGIQLVKDNLLTENDI